MEYRLLSYCISCRPRSLTDTYDDFLEARMRILSTRLFKYDVVCLQDVFWTRSSAKSIAELERNLQLQGFSYAVDTSFVRHTAFRRPDRLLIASRYPITNAQTMLFSTLCTGHERQLQRGCTYAQINFPNGRTLNIVNTSLQSDGGTAKPVHVARGYVEFTVSADVRMKQLLEVYQFMNTIAEGSAPAQSPSGLVETLEYPPKKLSSAMFLLVGCLNIDAFEKESPVENTDYTKQRRLDSWFDLDKGHYHYKIPSALRTTFLTDRSAFLESLPRRAFGVCLSAMKYSMEYFVMLYILSGEYAFKGTRAIVLCDLLKSLSDTLRSFLFCHNIFQRQEPSTATGFRLLSIKKFSKLAQSRSSAADARIDGSASVDVQPPGMASVSRHPPRYLSTGLHLSTESSLSWNATEPNYVSGVSCETVCSSISPNSSSFTRTASPDSTGHELTTIPSVSEAPSEVSVQSTLLKAGKHYKRNPKFRYRYSASFSKKRNLLGNHPFSVQSVRLFALQELSIRTLKCIPVTFGDIYVDADKITSRETCITPTAQRCSCRKVDYIFWVSLDRQNVPLTYPPCQVREMKVNRSEHTRLTQISDHYGLEVLL